MGYLYKHFQGLRIVFCLFAVCLWAQAAQADVYTIEGVEVDVTAKNAVEARQKAFEEAQIKAYEKLAERILSEEELQSFEAPGIETVSTLVRDYEVTNEQLSAVRYKGTYKIRFMQNAMRQKLADEGTTYTDVRRKSVLVLPYFENRGQTVLWDPNNPWMSAWARSGSDSSLTPTTVPIGDLVDVTQVNDRQPLNIDPAKLADMTQRYEAGEAVILVASPRFAPGGVQSLEVSMYRTDGGFARLAQSIAVPGQVSETENTLYDRAVKTVKVALQKDWKRQIAAAPAQTVSKIKARVRFNSVQEWVRTKKLISAVPGVQTVRVAGLKPREAQVEIQYAGPQERLQLAMQQSDLVLSAAAPSYPQANWGGVRQEPIYDLYLNRPGRY